ncbi:T5SS/PEP-CTERM-associated repeat protein [Paraburkholderia atlantica]|uniref:hypothetical protein n=1 Tax=Paraburkholderia atlantica TaxID=2654982 RepID=UPI003D204E6E
MKRCLMHPASGLLVCSTMLFASISFAQTLVINGNTTQTAAVGSTVIGTLVPGSSSGTVNGVPGGTFIVPAGADVALNHIEMAQQAGSSGLISVTGGTITAVNPQSQNYIGFNGSGVLTISNGGSVTGFTQTYLGTNPGSSGALTVDGQGSRYARYGFYLRRELRFRAVECDERRRSLEPGYGADRGHLKCASGCQRRR